MRELTTEGRRYRLPSIQNAFQEAMYVHLIDWKWRHITTEPGHYAYRGRVVFYDAILPDSVKDELPTVYPGVVDGLKAHRARRYFKLHQHFNHMASSQAANVNLFLPVLLSGQANEVLRRVKSDFGQLATAQLDRGFQLEYWGPEVDQGLLGDHTKRYGTDSDIAISYYDNTSKRQLCLWLIEHKLTENDFTKCHGFTSPGNLNRSNCKNTFSTLAGNMHYCYYHDVRRFRYWEITAENEDFFQNCKSYSECPFKGGTNQLWRNQLLGLAIENETTLPYERVCFSVVRHPENHHLDKTINEYRCLVGGSDRFSVFTSSDVVNAAAAVDDPELGRWVEWYRGLYKL